MKAVVICPDRRAEVAFLARKSPLALLPVLGPSLLSHWLTALADRGVKIQAFEPLFELSLERGILYFTQLGVGDLRASRLNDNRESEITGENGPTVHRQVWQMAEETIAAIQAFDGDGCFGHLSHILLLLQDPGFRETYQGDDATVNRNDRS